MIYQARSVIDGEGWHEVTIIDKPEVCVCARLIEVALRKAYDALHAALAADKASGIPIVEPKQYTGNNIHNIEIEEF